MKNYKSSFVMLALGLAFASCNSDKKPAEAEQADSTVSTVPAPPVSSDDIFTDTAKDAAGKMLIATFNNTKGTLSLNLDGEKIEMTQDTTASGVSAHNADYEYTSWHGETELKKKGKLVFSAKEKE